MFVTNTKPFVWGFGPVRLLPGANEVTKEGADYLATDKSFQSACENGFVKMHGAEGSDPETVLLLGQTGIDDLTEKEAIEVVSGLLSPHEANKVKKNAKNPKVREASAKQLDHILNGEKQI